MIDVDAVGMPLAVTGVGIVCAVGVTTEEAWSGALAGRTGILPLAGQRIPDVAGRWYAGQVPDATLATSPHHRRHDLDGSRAGAFALAAAREALGAAGGGEDVDPARIGVFVGTCLGPLVGEIAFQPDVPETLHSMHTLTDALGELAGATGPRMTATTACSSGAHAIGVACTQLRAGVIDRAVACGTDELCLSSFASFGSVGALDDVPCSPYGRSGGLNPAEGAAVLVIERADDAARRRADVVGWVLGYGSSADAYHPSAPDPTGRGPELAISRALADAGLDPVAVDHVNGHGTGTGPNDEMEAALFVRLFPHRPPVTATKSLTGHAFGGSSAIEVVASLLAVREGVIPASASGAVGPGIIDVVTGQPRSHDVAVALSTSYAFGGNNVALVVGRPDGPIGPRPHRPVAAIVAVTGIGAVGPGGLGREAWWAALSATGGSRAAAVTSAALDPTRYAARARWKRMADVARLAVAASRLAVEDAALWPEVEGDEEMAVVLASTDGPSDVAAEVTAVLADGPATVSPGVTANMALSSMAGHVSWAFGWNGPSVTLMSGGSGAAALAHAVHLVADGRVRRAVVVGADVAGERGPDAAIAFVVEDGATASARGATIHGWIDGVVLRSAMGAGEEARDAAWADAHAGVCGPGVGAIVLSASDDAVERRSAAAIHGSPTLLAPHRTLGDCRAGGVGLGLLVALRHLSEDGGPGAVVVGCAGGACEVGAVRLTRGPGLP